MKNIDKYNDYMIDLLLEKVKIGETILGISKKLLSYLTTIDHPISKKLITDYKSFTDNDSFKITLLDVVEKQKENGDNVYDLWSFLQTSKAVELVAKNYNIDLEQELTPYDFRIISARLFSDDIYDKITSKSETTVGRVIKKLYKDEFKDHEIGEFVEMYKALRNPLTTFEIVSGEDIRYWYNEKNYKKPKDDSALWQSCMRHNKCHPYLEFYVINKDCVRMLILKDPEDDTKIMGRAIVWKIDILDAETVENRYFMDRIYYMKEYYINSFINYAKEQGWLYKSKQNMLENEDIIDSVDNSIHKDIIILEVENPDYGGFPYMDTLKYYDWNELSNNDDNFDNSEDGYIQLTSVSGLPNSDDENYDEDDDSFYSEYYDNYFNLDYTDATWCEDVNDIRFPDDCFYSGYYDLYIANDYAEDNGVFCEYYENDDEDNGWRRDSDYVSTPNDDTATKDFADDNWFFSGYSNEWFMTADWSNYHNTHIDPDKSIEVITNLEDMIKDFRVEGDGTYFEYNNTFYDKSIKKEDIKNKK